LIKAEIHTTIADAYPEFLNQWQAKKEAVGKMVELKEVKREISVITSISICENTEVVAS